MARTAAWRLMADRRHAPSPDRITFVGERVLVDLGHDVRVTVDHPQRSFGEMLPGDDRHRAGSAPGPVVPVGVAAGDDHVVVPGAGQPRAAADVTFNSQSSQDMARLGLEVPVASPLWVAIVI